MIKICTVLFSVFLLSGCQNTSRNDIQIVATNSWTSAFAKAAGVKNVKLLAPMEMEHPSEYELRPGDIPALHHAKLVLFAGYEVIASKIVTGLDIDTSKILKIETTYRFETIQKSVMAIAIRMGTEKTALKNLEEIRLLYDSGRVEVKKRGLNSKPILVSYFLQPFVKELDFEKITVFGPSQLEAAEIKLYAISEALCIFDNVHNPAGIVLKDLLPGASYVQLVNFPGINRTITLQDVIRYNIGQILKNK